MQNASCRLEQDRQCIKGVIEHECRMHQVVEIFTPNYYISASDFEAKLLVCNCQVKKKAVYAFSTGKCDLKNNSLVPQSFETSSFEPPVHD